MLIKNFKLLKNCFSLFALLIILAAAFGPGPSLSLAQATNIAQGKPASADSAQSANPAANGNDGNTSTRWCANDGNTGHWWQVDLGAVTALSGSEVMWEFSGRVYQYRVQVSNDASTWTTVLDKTGNTSTAQTQNDPFTASARYVRITVTGLATSPVTWASFFEFRVFGAGGGTPTPTPTQGAGPTATPTRTPTAGSGSTVYQAETAVLGGGAATETTNGGYNGSGYVNFPANGGTLEFQNVNGGAGGSQTLRFRNALGATAARTGQLTVNGSTQNITFDPTGAWNTWTYKDVVVSLNSGTGNTVRLASTGSDLANVDELVVAGSGGPTSTPTRTNTPGGPTNTPTRTPTSGGPTATPTRTPTSGAGSFQTITNDTVWKDTSGNTIYAQGGGMLKVGDTYYWYGTDFQAAHDSSKSAAFLNIKAYSSTDLKNWTFRANVITQQPAGQPFQAAAWVGRPDVIYNANTQKYVMLINYEFTDNGSGPNGVAFATSSSPTGAFTYAGVQTVISNVYFDRPGDQSVFVDEDGKAYLIFCDSHGRQRAYVAPIRASDYLQIEPATQIYLYGSGGMEANTMFKRNGVYYNVVSETAGWAGSQTSYQTASSIFGPYSSLQIMSGSSGNNSHQSQVDFVLKVQGASGTMYMYAGDRWSDFISGQGTGFYVWEPLSFSGNTPTFNNLSSWKINAAAGTWSN